MTFIWIKDKEGNLKHYINLATIKRLEPKSYHETLMRFVDGECLVIDLPILEVVAAIKPTK